MTRSVTLKPKVTTQPTLTSTPLPEQAIHSDESKVCGISASPTFELDRQAIVIFLSMKCHIGLTNFGKI
jgi:hypothetical protein